MLNGMENDMDQQYEVEPGNQVVLPVTLNVPSGTRTGSAYILTFKIHVLHPPRQEHTTDWEPVARKGMPPYEQAAEWGVRQIRKAARERELAPHRKIGGMSRAELLELLYRPEADTALEAEKERPRRRAQYARIGNGKVLHRGRCPQIARALGKERVVEEMNTVQARRFAALETTSYCPECDPRPG